MTRWNNARTLGGMTLVLAVAGAWLAGRSPADTPPKPSADRISELEKRLQSVEEKLDRALRLLEGRTASAPASVDIPRLVKAREEAEQTLAKQEAAYAEFKKRSLQGC